MPESAKIESPEEYEWMQQAVCKDTSPGKFFPTDSVSLEAAQRVCAMCEVRVECLEYALNNRVEHGVWGGSSEQERRRIFRRGRRQNT